MNITLLTLFALIFTNPALADNRKEIADFCRLEKDFLSCERAYKGLPPLLPTSTTINMGKNIPIAIKVIPFSSNNDKNTNIPYKARGKSSSKRFLERRNIKPKHRRSFLHENSWYDPLDD